MTAEETKWIERMNKALAKPKSVLEEGFYRWLYSQAVKADSNALALNPLLNNQQGKFRPSI